MQPEASWPCLGALGLFLELPGLLLVARPSPQLPGRPGGLAKVLDAHIQPGGPPGHSWVLLGCSWKLLGCSWLPLAMLARIPKSSQELLLAIPGCS